MFQSHVEELKQVYVHLFKDVVYAFPTLRDEFEKDQIRLEKFVERRGLHAFCVDLPALGKHLDQALASGEYKLSGLPLSKRYSNRVVIPKFLRGLYLLVFDEHGSLKEDYNVEAVFFLRQLLYAGKKTSIQCDETRVQDEIKDFLLIDSSLPLPESFWKTECPQASDIESTYGGFAKSELYRNPERGGTKLTGTSLSNLLTALDFVSGLVTTTLGAYKYAEWKFRHGPGAVSNLPSRSNKYEWTNWSNRLEYVFPLADCGFHNYTSWGANSQSGSISSEEPMSKLVAVPKTFTKPRLIACEPSENQWCQQNIWHFLATRVEESWISKFVRFRDQTRNQELCMRGSVDGSLATVDLSAASDRVTCHVVGQFFRNNQNLLIALQATRTQSLKQLLVKDLPEVTELRKFSTMGSACTFPVETLLFLGIALAAVMAKRQMPLNLRSVMELSSEVAIFGDDIVIPTDSRELLFGALEVLHFKVNSAKSFWTGKFRESCGVDSFAGNNVTPAFWKAPYSGTPDSYASTVEVANNFYDKFLVNTSNYLASTIQRVNPPVVPYESGFVGLRSFVAPVSLPGFKLRYNESLQRSEYKVPQLSSVGLRTPITNDTALHQFFTEEPEPSTKWVGGVAQRAKTKVRLRWVSVSDLGLLMGSKG